MPFRFTITVVYDPPDDREIIFGNARTQITNEIKDALRDVDQTRTSVMFSEREALTPDEYLQARRQVNR